MYLFVNNKENTNDENMNLFHRCIIRNANIYASFGHKHTIDGLSVHCVTIKNLSFCLRNVEIGGKLPTIVHFFYKFGVFFLPMIPL